MLSVDPLLSTEHPDLSVDQTRRRSPNSDKSRNAALDGIRGIAVSLVLLYHFSLYHQTFFRSNPWWLRPEAWVFDVGSQMGWIGVEMFFVLSGFLITGILEDAKGHRHYFTSFYWRRALRILPLYYAVLLLYLVVLPHWPMPAWANLDFVREHQLWYWSFLSNFLFAGPAGWPRLSSHFWTLAVEEQFYLAWPLVVFWLDRKRVINVCVALMAGGLVLRILLITHGIAPRVAYLLTPTELDGLLAGALLAMAIRSPSPRPFVIRHGRFLVCLSLIVLAAVVLRDHGLAFADPLVPLLGFTALAVLFGSLVYVGATKGSTSHIATILGNPAGRFLGRYSYAIYLLHMPIIQLWRAPMQAEVLLVANGIPPFLAHLAYMIAVTAGILLLSLVSWYFLERPFMRLRRLTDAMM